MILASPIPRSGSARMLCCWLREKSDRRVKQGLQMRVEGVLVSAEVNPPAP